MRTLILLVVLAGVMSAQDFHGVSIGGTPQIPTIINHAKLAIYGFVLVRHSTTIPHNILDANGVWHLTTDYTLTHNTFSADRIVYGGGIRPGDEVTPGSLVLGMTSSMVDPLTKQEVPMGDATSWEITGVLFSNGTFYGADSEFEYMAPNFNLARSYARALQYSEDRERLVALDARPDKRAAVSRAPRHPNEQALAQVLLNLRNFQDKAAMDVGIARIAGMPDMVKGGN